jgi:hypothetical protein
VPATAGYMQQGPAHFLLVLPALACNSTSVYEPGGREFESLRARQLINLTQLSTWCLSNIQTCIRGFLCGVDPNNLSDCI